MFFKRLHILFPLFLLFVPLVLFSQNRLSGQILDAENNALEFAVIEVENESNSLVQSSFSDESGKFEITCTNGTYILKVFYLEKNLYQDKITVTENLDIGIIKIDNALFLQEVVITKSNQIHLKKELGKFTVQNIANSQFSKGKNIVEVLKYVL